MTTPEAGPVTYLLLRGEGNRRTRASPAGSASFLRGAVLHSVSNVCTLVAMLAGLVDEPTSTVLQNAVERETVLALSIDDRERILRALDDPPDGLAELRAVVLREHEWRVREGLV